MLSKKNQWKALDIQIKTIRRSLTEDWAFHSERKLTKIEMVKEKTCSKSLFCNSSKMDLHLNSNMTIRRNSKRSYSQKDRTSQEQVKMRTMSFKKRVALIPKLRP